MTKEEENALEALVNWFSHLKNGGSASLIPVLETARALFESRKPDPVKAFLEGAYEAGGYGCDCSIKDFKICGDCQCRRAIQAGLDAADKVKS